MTTADPFAALAALPCVATAQAELSVALGRLASLRALARDPGQIRAEMGLRAARAGALLVGESIPMPVLRAGGVPDTAGGLVAGATLRLYAELVALGPSWASAPRQVMARLHVLAAKSGGPDDSSLGRPASPEAAVRLDLLAQALRAPTSAPPVVVAAVVHGEIWHSGAFGECSALVARAASRLVLIGTGVDPHAVLPPEVGHAGMGPADYRGALDRYGSGGADGVGAWVAHCLRALEVAALEVGQVCLVIRPGVRGSAYATGGDVSI